MRVELDPFDYDESIDFGNVVLHPAKPQSARDNRLLHAVASEIATLAGPIAAVTGLLNTETSAKRAGIEADVLEPLLPPEPVVYRAVLEQLAATESELFADLQHFHARMAVTRTATLASAADAAAPRRGQIHLDVLADAWRELCLAAVEILDRASEREGAAQSWLTQLPRLRDILTRTANGEAPCVKADGSVEVPGIAERRQQPRYPVDWPARLRLGNGHIPIRLFDLSRGGLGAECALALNAGERATVCVTGRNLSGHVRWAKAGRFAIQFDEQLAPADPLITTARSIRPAT